MKTKIFKIGMPIMVFMMAIVLAFASEKTTANDESLIIGYIYENNECKPATRECSNDGAFPCTQGVFQVYMTNLGGTACLGELTHWEP